MIFTTFFANLVVWFLMVFVGLPIVLGVIKGITDIKKTQGKTNKVKKVSLDDPWLCVIRKGEI